MPYINLQQAAETTGKSVRTIRRLCNLPESKDYINYEDGKLMIDVSYLERNYSLVNVPKPVTSAKQAIGHISDMDSQHGYPYDNIQNVVNLAHEIDLLKLEIKHRDQIAQEKDKRIEVLERSLLLLGEAKQTEVNTNQVPIENPVKKKRWWQW